MARRATVAILRHLAGVLAVAFGLLIPSGVQAPTDPVTALAPIELWADGFQDLRGIVVDQAGNVYVADRAARTVTRIAPDHTKTIIASNLERPIGLAFDLQDRLLIAEERAGRIVRLEPNGTLTPLISDVKQPRWLAMHENGTLYLSARRLTRDTDPEPDDESAEPEIILALSPSGQLSLFADGFKQLQGLAANHDTVSALAIQFFHLVEHVAQVYQHWWLGLRGQGLLFFLDLEWDHFLFNLGYFALLAWILGALWFTPEWKELRKRVAVGSFLVAVVIQAYHVIEHTVRMGQYYQYGCTPCPGLLGRSINLVTLHFTLNTLVWLLPLALLPILWRALHTTVGVEKRSSTLLTSFGLSRWRG